MLSKIIINKNFLIILSLLLFTACSSSSYYDRYETKQKKIPIKVEAAEKSDVELEDGIPKIPYDDLILGQNEIIERIHSNIKSSSKKERFLVELVKYLNAPYQYGGNSKDGIDCSAFTMQVYKKSFDIDLPRTAREQYKNDKVFEDKELLKFGDLIYFDTSKIYFPGHVGIYLENDLFAHASASNGVIISSLNNYYYSDKFVGANRVKAKKH